MISLAVRMKPLTNDSDLTLRVRVYELETCMGVEPKGSHIMPMQIDTHHQKMDGLSLVGDAEMQYRKSSTGTSWVVLVTGFEAHFQHCMCLHLT
jgi:hypothetical protein